MKKFHKNSKFNPRYSKLNYPQCRSGNCPQFYFDFLSVASRGSGKTFDTCKLISHYEQNDLIDNDGNIHPLQTIVISPTLDANPIFKGLASLDEADIHDKFSDALLQSIVDDIKKYKEETELYQKYIQAYKSKQNKRKQINCFL